MEAGIFRQYNSMNNRLYLGSPVESIRQRLHLLLLKHQDAIRRNTRATQYHAGEVEGIAAALLELIKETEGLQNLLNQVRLSISVSYNFRCS